jgi:hypothetical protein
MPESRFGKAGGRKDGRIDSKLPLPSKRYKSKSPETESGLVVVLDDACLLNPSGSGHCVKRDLFKWPQSGAYSLNTTRMHRRGSPVPAGSPDIEREYVADGVHSHDRDQASEVKK